MSDAITVRLEDGATHSAPRCEPCQAWHPTTCPRDLRLPQGGLAHQHAWFAAEDDLKRIAQKWCPHECWKRHAAIVQ